MNTDDKEALYQCHPSLSCDVHKAKQRGAAPLRQRELAKSHLPSIHKKQLLAIWGLHYAKYLTA